MARTFRRHRQMHALSELNVTNLLDLAFVLLIIFMISAPLLDQEQTIPVNLPVESQNNRTPPDDDDRFIAVTVRADGTYLFDGDTKHPVASRDLPARLRAAAGTSGERNQPVFRIRADANTPYQNIITLMDELQKAGLNRLSFDTRVKT